MAPGNKERHTGHTGTIPKTKVRNNCNVPQEAVTPTRRDMASNLVTTSLDWVPVSEYNARSNCNQSRKQTNNTSDQESTDLDNSVSFESGFGRFVPVRPQPRALPLTVQNRENLTTDHHDDGASSSHNLHPYAHQMSNGMIPHSNHAAAAVMIVNPTTPNAVTGNMTQQLNVTNQNRNNLTRNLNSTRNTFEGNNTNNNNPPPVTNSRSGTKSVNLMNNMYDQGHSSFNNINENNQAHRESARALGEAIVAACPDAAAVERRLGQIREYIRVTSSLVDTMRNSEDEAFIEHTKEEYDELVKMVMQLKESETKLQSMLVESNNETPSECSNYTVNQVESSTSVPVNEVETVLERTLNQEKSSNIKTYNDNSPTSNLKKVTNIENEHLNKNITNSRASEENLATKENKSIESENKMEDSQSNTVEIREIESIPCADPEVKKDDQYLNDILRKNITACVEKIALIQEMKSKNKDISGNEVQQDVVVRPVSVQSNASAYSENELWQNEIKNKMEMSQIRLSALKQQQKRLLKYQAEAKQQLEEINKERQAQEMNHPSTSHENFNAMQNLTMSANYHNQNRMYGANQIGVATTLPQAGDLAAELEHARAPSVHSRDERLSLRDGNVASSEEAAGGTRDSEVEDDDVILSERERILQLKLRELQMKKQHMENLVSEFQKLQMATRVGSSHNTYSSSGEDSGDEEASRKCNKSGVNLKNEDPFKLMEIKAIKTALQKTKDLMRSVETFEGNLPGAHEDNFHVSNLSNIHDNKSEGGGSMSGWSNEDSVCRVRNSLSQRHKFTNEQHSQQQLQPQQHLQQSQHQQHLQQTQPQQHLQQLQHLQQTQHQHHLQQAQHQQQLQQAQHQQQLQQAQHQQHLQQTQHMQLQQHQQHMQAPQHQQHSQQNHEANINTLQELAQELRMETEKIMGERARIKDMVTNKERKQKKVNEVRGGCVGPAERRQLQLRALLADKQRELEALLNKEAMSNATETQNIKPNSRVASVVNQSYNSEQEEPESRSEHVQMDSQNSRDNDNFRGGDSALGSRSVNTAPSHLGSGYGSDSDSASRNKSNQRNRPRRRPTLDRQSEDNNLPLVNNSNSNVRHEPRVDSNVNMVPPVAQNNDNTGNMPYSHMPPCWNTTKSNQDMRTNQFTQNSHSQTMDRLMGTPMSFPPTMPFNMMMPYGMVGCGCGCGLWGAWCWQQLALQQRELHQLRDQLAHLEERWRAETASHTLNNQVPPGNRANNYWDNFRSYSRQNLLSGSSKSNAECVGGGVGVGGGPGCGAGGGAAPLAERSHNSLHHTSSSTSPSLTPKRNTEEARLSSAPDVLNVNQNEPELVTRRNLNCADPIPEVVQSHSNLDSPAESRRKSSKLPSKNSASRRNYADFPATGDVTATAEAPNPNLASASRELRDKATSKLFDLLRENIYSEVTTLIGVNESHPDFLIQLFRELQLISSDPLRQRVLQSIRSVLSQYSNFIESRTEEADSAECTNTTVTTTSVEPSDCQDCSGPSVCTSTVQIDNRIVRFLLLKSEEIFTSELLESLASLILNNSSDGRQLKRLLDLLSKYEGMRVCDVSSDIVENMPIFNSVSNEGDESIHVTNEIPESSILQDVAGSLNLFSSSEGQLHQMNTCPYDMWPGHIHMDIDGGDTNAGSTRSSQEGKVDLINCSEMHNGDLAEADQTCHAEAGDSSGNTHDDVGNAEALPDVVDTEEVTPTEAEAEWLGLDRVPTRLHMEESSEKQKGDI